MAGMECYEILDQISKNEKGGHSDMSQGNPKGCSLERQAGCVHSDKHARSPVEGNFTQESGQAMKPRAVEDYNVYMRFVDKSEWSTAMELPAEHDSGSRNCFFT